MTANPRPPFNPSQWHQFGIMRHRIGLLNMEFKMILKGDVICNENDIRRLSNECEMLGEQLELLADKLSEKS